MKWERVAGEARGNAPLLKYKIRHWQVVPLYKENLLLKLINSETQINNEMHVH